MNQEKAAPPSTRNHPHDPASSQGGGFARAAFFTGFSGLLYSLTFVLVSGNRPELGGLLSSIFLMFGGLFTSAALTGIYKRLRQSATVDPDQAFWAYLLSFISAIGACVHGGYDLAHYLDISQLANYIPVNIPNPVDPRGLFTFGLTGLGLWFLTNMMYRSRQFTRGLSTAGTVLSILLVVVYLSRLVIPEEGNLFVLVPALLAGFIANPLFYFWLAAELRPR